MLIYTPGNKHPPFQLDVEMSISNEFSVDGNILVIIGSGPVDTAEELEQNTEIRLQHMVNAGCTRILADDRGFKVRLNTFELYKAASSDAKSFREMPAKKFGVILPQTMAEDARFYENVAHNRGFRIQFFFNEEEAWKWIRN